MTEPLDTAAPQPCQFRPTAELRCTELGAMCDALSAVAARTTGERRSYTPGSRRCLTPRSRRRRRSDDAAGGVAADGASSRRLIADLVALLRRSGVVDRELVVLDRELVFDLAQALLDLSSRYASSGASLESFALEGIEGRLLEALVDPCPGTPEPGTPEPGTPEPGTK